MMYAWTTGLVYCQFVRMGVRSFLVWIGVRLLFRKAI